ncbi:TPA: hypothetical protein ACPTYG_000895 [Escherichia coli]|nr:hypothetical protein [Escherichia coli]EFC1681012.1 hypothetical protein [Escherichia coli]EFE0691789.1 hypothetical protein [Escherichia coli]EIH3565993.1 hypothetical protein [Escherichia coli]EIY1688216.1 hypothetical protein [Escherichia coli]QLX19963.1 hypothetical protein HV238_07405 [Escherichia coli]
MKQMTLIEMDGFLKGKCIPRDLKVNETNAEYLVRKFAEIESKLETALRECRSAGITIDNLEAKCAALAADNKKAMEAMRQADAAVKLAHEKFSALTAENAGMKATCEDRRTFIMNGVQLGYIKVPTVDTDPALDTIRVAVSPQEPTPATDAFLAEVKTEARKEGAYFVANRMLAAWEAGFIDDTAKNAADIARMILTSTEFMANAPEGDFDRSFSDGVLEDIAAQLRKGVQS